MRCPLVIVHGQRIRQWTVLALVLRIRVGSVIHEKLDQAAVLQMQSTIQVRISVGSRGIHLGSMVEQELNIVLLIAHYGPKRRSCATGTGSEAA